MRQQQPLPEMVHSSTYYRDGAQHHLMTGFLPESSSSSSPSAPATTPVPTRSTTPPLSPPAAARLPEAASGHRYSHSNPYQSQHRHHPYNHRSLPGESMGSGPEPPPPVSLVESDSIVTRGSNGTSRTTRKERARESLSGHSSYMSGEQRRHHRAPSASRTPKQTLYEEAPVPDPNQDALVMLFRLTVPLPIFAFCASLYTVLALLFALLVSPLRLCSLTSYLKRASFRTQLCDLLVPALHAHERLIGLVPAHRRHRHFYEDDHDTDHDPDVSAYQQQQQHPMVDPSEGFSVSGLIVVLLLSSFLSLALLLLAWTAAFFWVFALLLGNPDGTERKDDGRAAVLGVCRWWQRWLGKARRFR